MGVLKKINVQPEGFLFPMEVSYIRSKAEIFEDDIVSISVLAKENKAFNVFPCLVGYGPSLLEEVLKEVNHILAEGKATAR